jgi:hypothetical protein
MFSPKGGLSPFIRSGQGLQLVEQPTDGSQTAISMNQRPGYMLIISKLFPCFSCCQKYANKKSQILQGNERVSEEEKKEDKLEATGEFKLNSSSFKDIKSGSKKDHVLDDSEEQAAVQSREPIREERSIEVKIQNADISD